MITEKARIVAIDEKEVLLESVRHSACDTCKIKTGCGQKVLNAMAGGQRHLIRLPIDGALQNGKIDDIVDLAIEEGALLRGSMLLYIFPLVMMIAGAFISNHYLSIVVSQELSSIIGAAAGFVIAFLLIRLHAVINSHNPRHRPTVCYSSTQSR